MNEVKEIGKPSVKQSTEKQSTEKQSAIEASRKNELNQLGRVIKQIICQEGGSLSIKSIESVKRVCAAKNKGLIYSVHQFLSMRSEFIVSPDNIVTLFNEKIIPAAIPLEVPTNINTVPTTLSQPNSRNRNTVPNYEKLFDAISTTVSINAPTIMDEIGNAFHAAGVQEHEKPNMNLNERNVRDIEIVEKLCQLKDSNHQISLSTLLVNYRDTLQIPQSGVFGRICYDAFNDGLKSFGNGNHSTLPRPLITALSTYIPFCAVTVGVQGSGKSHTVSTIIENCILNTSPVTEVPLPSLTLVFHYDRDPYNYCEAVSLTVPANNKIPGLTQSPCVDSIAILCSPSFYEQRRHFYSSCPNVTVFPLLFSWSNLSSSNIVSLMQISKENSMPLYMYVVLDLMRKCQKRGGIPSFPDFKDHIMTQIGLNSGQIGGLQQRLHLIESLLVESDENKNFPKTDLQSLFKKTQMVIADLTDPMLGPDEANGIFDVLLVHFQSVKLESRRGKLAVFDEAHKYLKTCSSNDDLSSTIVQIARQMRHHGMRLVISSQKPNSIPEELLELVSIAIIHRFHSRDWFSYLKRKLPLTDEAFDCIMELPTGNALVFSSRWAESITDSVESFPFGHGVFQVRIRDRLTVDAGFTKASIVV